MAQKWAPQFRQLKREHRSQAAVRGVQCTTKTVARPRSHEQRFAELLASGTFWPEY